jgi:hypothetical protein
MVGLAEDDMFTKKHSVANKSFIKSMAKNRAYTGVEGASYTKIDDNEEFKKAMKSGALNQESTGSRIQKQFKYIEMNNVRINRNDLINSQEKDLTIGTRVQSEREKIMQAIEIKNSKIKTDKELNVGVVSSSDKVSGITSVNTIDRSELEGGSNQDRSSIMRQEEISLGDQ